MLDYNRMGRVFAEIMAERERQERLLKEGKFKHSCDSAELTDLRKLSVLAEEFGEVARLVNDMAEFEDMRHNRDARAHLREELVQVAAVCAAWLQADDMQVKGE